MIRFVAYSLLSLTAVSLLVPPALAENWLAVGTTASKDTEFLDMSSIRQVGKYHLFSTKVKFASPKTVKNGITQEILSGYKADNQLDCANYDYQVQAIHALSRSGMTVFTLKKGDAGLLPYRFLNRLAVIEKVCD